MVLPYNPGVLPKYPAPTKGDEILIEVQGLPPYKDVSKSIRNRKHKFHDRFILLREEATNVMAFRAWTFELVKIEMVIFSKLDRLEKSLHEYVGGVTDTIDGSSGFTFTYLPIVFEDDSQVISSRVSFKDSEEDYYTVKVTFE